MTREWCTEAGEVFALEFTIDLVPQGLGCGSVSVDIASVLFDDFGTCSMPADDEGVSEGSGPADEDGPRYTIPYMDNPWHLLSPYVIGGSEEDRTPISVLTGLCLYQ